MPMKVAVLFSGGKDSAFAVYDCLRKGYDIRYLVTMMPQNPESYMFHYPNIRWTGLQAESMGIKHIMHRTSGGKESEVSDLAKAVRPLRHEIDAVAAGGLASAYQADRIGKVCHSLGLKPVIPFWHTDIGNYWRMIIKAGFEVIMTGVAAEGLGRDWLGKRIGLKGLEKLSSLSDRHRFNLGGEGGEFETMVLDGPIFKKKLVPLESEVQWDSRTGSGFYIINDMMAIDKPGLEKLMKEYSRSRAAIKNRLREFELFGKTASDEALFAELAFCLCTPQSKAKACWHAVELLDKGGLLMKGRRDDMEKCMKGVRFHRNKARYIEMARAADLKGIIMDKNPLEARELLAGRIKGLGYKEASHFLRNIGAGKGIAILDRHIMKNLKKLGVIKNAPKALTKKKYMWIEKRLLAFCSSIGISEEELDLLLWSRETGEIFK